ncbi:MAG: nucleoside recognition domain-containing protein [Christensenellales bacterium]
MQSFFQGIRLWATKVLPALLPFFILVKLLSYTTFSKSIGKFLTPITHKLYGVGGVSGYIYIMSILSGYPVGAKLTAEIYKDGGINKGQAHTISSFTSTSGPLFVLGTVGIGLFGNQLLGIVVLISHYLGAILNGLIYRYKDNSVNAQASFKDPTNTLNDCMTSSIMSILVVGGFIAIFYMLLTLLLHINAFSLPTYLLSKIGIPKELTIATISGFIEVTTGMSLLSQCAISFDLQAIIASFLISFGGLSIHAQAYCFLSNFDMPYSKFLLQKLTHASLSAIITLLIVLIF